MGAVYSITNVIQITSSLYFIFVRVVKKSAFNLSLVIFILGVKRPRLSLMRVRTSPGTSR